MLKLHADLESSYYTESIDFGETINSTESNGPLLENGKSYNKINFNVQLNAVYYVIINQDHICHTNNNYRQKTYCVAGCYSTLELGAVPYCVVTSFSCTLLYQS